MFLGAQVARHVGGQPLHDDVVGPVHGEVGEVHRPQWPVRQELAPVDIMIIDLKNVRYIYKIIENL